MTSLRSSVTLCLAIWVAGCIAYPPVRTDSREPIDFGRPLPLGADALLPLGPGEPVPDLRATWFQRAEILPALAQSLDWTRSPQAGSFFPIEGVTHARALASIERFQELLETTESADAFQGRFEAEFDVYKSAGWDGRGGGVLFTGYCTPLLAGSLTRTNRYAHPLHALPPDLVKAEDGTTLGRRTPDGLVPYPNRDKILRDPAYDTLTIAWLSDPVDAYIAQVNGSAFLELESGEIARFGYAGKNGRPYASLGRALIEAGEVSADEMSLTAIRRWAAANPGKVDGFLSLNQSYVFFTQIDHAPHGSLDVPVTPMRTVATDKSLFPRGALTFVDTALPSPAGDELPFRQLMFDQDTGGAIRTAGRADLYLGVGHRAERMSGSTRAEGQLYYFFLAE